MLYLAIPLPCCITLRYYNVLSGRVMVRQPLYGREESQYTFNVYIVDDCGSASSYVPVVVTFLRNVNAPSFQV